MDISFRRLTKTDELFLNDVLEDSFNSDSQLHLGKEIKLGPPGYDNGNLSKKIMSNEQFTSLLINMNDQKVGVLIFTEGKPNHINYFCLDPIFIGKNIGSLVWETFERNQSGTWQLETPEYSFRNHHFYKKNGFQKISEKTDTNGSKSFLFEKVLMDVAPSQ